LKKKSTFGYGTEARTLGIVGAWPPGDLGSSLPSRDQRRSCSGSFNGSTILPKD